jgi:uncharacterized membrane protein YagU involved in acid resistance
MGKIDSKAAIWSGLIAGLVFLVMEMVLVATVGGGSAWGPPRMIGAIVLGQDVLPPPATFDLGVVLVAMVVHFVLSVVLAFVFALITASREWSLAITLLAGAVFGLAVYFVNFYGFTALFPWFAMARTPITLISHVVFGVVLAWSYRALLFRTQPTVRSM